MPNFIQTLAEQTGSQMIGGIMGLALGGINDRRQYNQQERLQGLQIQGQKQMTDYQFQKQLEMWRATNYSAQVEQMKQAGINPGLLYGMSGGGATTTGGGGANVQGASAPTGGREVQDIMGLQMQRELLKAQKENIEADTANKLGDAANKPIIGKNIETQTLDLTQGIQNKKAIEIYTKVQTRLSELDEQLKGKTIDEQEEIIEWTASTLKYQMEMAEREAFMQKATMQNKIDQVKAELINTYLRNTLTSAQTQATKAGTIRTGAETTNIQQDTALKAEQINKISQEITNMVTELGQKWYQLSMQERQTMMTERIVKFNTALSQRTYDNILRGVSTVAGAFKPGTTINQGPKETNIYNQ